MIPQKRGIVKEEREIKTLILAQLGYFGAYVLLSLMITAIMSGFDADEFSHRMTRFIGGGIGLALTYMLTDIGLWAFGLI